MFEDNSKANYFDSSNSSSGSSSAHRKQSRRFVDRFPSRTSEWTTDHLCRLGVNFSETSVDLSSFMFPIKEIYRQKYGEDDNLPKVYKDLLQHAKDRWNFSFDFQKETLSNDETAVQNGIKQIMGAIKSLKEEQIEQHDRTR
jgi:hypothetical protein